MTVSESREMDIDKQTAYWKASSMEDMEVGALLIAQRKFRHGLFFVHLWLEKALKAYGVRGDRRASPEDPQSGVPREAGRVNDAG